MEKKIYRKVLSKNLAIEHVCEVGVFLPELSNIVDFIVQKRIRTTLVEPDPRSIAAIRKYFHDYEQVRLFPCAVYDYNGELELVQREASTFAAALPYSPAQVNDNYTIKENDTFRVACKRFDDIDDGTIGLLSVDTEGCEWYAIKYMKSRPVIISVETHGNSYRNPFLKEISEWMVVNGYEKWYMDRSDTVYYKKGTFEITALEKFGLLFMGFYLSWRKAKKNAIRGLAKAFSKKESAN